MNSLIIALITFTFGGYENFVYAQEYPSSVVASATTNSSEESSSIVVNTITNSTFKPDLSTTQIIKDSLVGELHKERWHELSFATLFSEGWNEPYAPVSHYVPRQTWIGSADGAFYRLFVVSSSYAQLASGAGNQTSTSSLLFTPFNRRFEIGWYAPWDVSTPSGNSSGQASSFGDLTVTPRLMLHESTHLSLVSSMAIRLPTGNIATGNGVTSLSPDIEFWSHPISKLVVRGGFGVTLQTGQTAQRTQTLNANPWSGFNSNPSAFDTIDARLALGNYITPSTGEFLGDFVYYLCGNLHKGMDSNTPTYMTLTPGFRHDVWNSWYFLGGVEVPVVKPVPFDYQVTFQLIGNF